MMRWSLWIPLILFAAFAGFAGWQLSRPKSEFVVSAMIGKPLPDFDLRAAVGDRPGLSSDDFKDGKPRLLNIWASWCLPCIAEAPQLDALRQQGVDITSVAIRDQPADVAQFLASYGNPYTRIGADDRSEVQLGIGSSGVPETFVIDGQGIIRYQHIGDIRAEHVPMLLEKLREAGT